MPITFFSNAWTTLKARVLYRGAAAPSNTKYYFCLCSGGSFNRATALKDYVWEEPLQFNGYQRNQVFYNSDGSFNNTTLRHEMPLSTVSWTPANAALTFQTGFLLANGHARPNDNWDNTMVNTSTNVITLTGHLLANGDAVLLRAASGATLAAPFVENTLYYAVNVAVGSSFQLSTTPGGAAIDITTTGSGITRMKYCTGTVVFASVEDLPVTVAIGRQIDYDVSLTEQAATYGNGI